MTGPYRLEARLKRYGIPYRGSKSRIAERIVSCFPEGNRFLDAMCGGGAILHCVAESGKFESVAGMEIDPQMAMVLSYVMHGCLDRSHDEKALLEWLPSEEFHRIKSVIGIPEGIRTILYSFATNRQDYLYSRDKEPIMRLVHEMACSDDIEERMATMRKLAPFLKAGSLDKILRFDIVTRLRSMFETSERMRTAKQNVEVSVKTGSALDVPMEFYDGFDCIYFDPPYKNTRPYRNERFDFDAFDLLLSRLQESGKTVFVSELREPVNGYSVVGRWELNHSVNKDSSHRVTELLWKSGPAR